MPSPIAPLVRLSGVVVALVALAGDAHAGFKAKMVDADPATSVKVILDSSPLEPGGSFKAGEYDWTRTDTGTGTYAFMSGKNFSTFCIEITQFINSGTSYDWEVVDMTNAPQTGPGQGSGTATGMGPYRKNMLQELFEKNFKTLYDGANTAEKNLRAAAFQVAIWEIVFEGPIGASYPSPLKSMEGNFRLHGDYAAVGAKAQTYLNSVTSSGAYNGPFTYNLQAITNGNQQDQLVWSLLPPPGDGNPVPAPPGLVLLASAAFPVVAVRLRRIRKPVTI